MFQCCSLVIPPGGVGVGDKGDGGGYLVFQLLTPLLHAPVLRQKLCMLRVLAIPSLQRLCDAASCRVHLHTPHA